MSSVAPKDVCDLLVYGAYLLTVDAERRVFADGALAIVGTRIEAIGKTVDLRSKWEGRREIDAKGAVVHPGFVECHIHLSIHAGRNAITEPVDWQSQQSFYSGLWNAMTDEDEYVGSKHGCLELVLHGATAFLECGTVLEPDAAARAAEEVGIRAVLGDPFIWDEGGFGGRGDKSPPIHRAPASAQRAEKLLGTQLKRNSVKSLVRGHVAIIGMGTCSESLTREAKALARKSDVVLNQHQSYGQEDAAEDAERFGKPALVKFREMGVLDSRTTFAHMNALTSEEVRAMSGTGMSVVWCPLASMMYGVGATATGKHFELTKCGCNVALGSDSPNYTGRFDTGAQAFAAVLASREQARSADALKAEDGLVMATINGAKALGLDHLIGSLEAGKLADLVIRDPTIIESVPRTNRIQNLIYSSRSVGIDTVIVNGTTVVEQGRSTRVNHSRVLLDAQRSSNAVLTRMGYSVKQHWPVIS
jgi:5-methylthioadenosine/S-adenosylhomocysteine deaminase